MEQIGKGGKYGDIKPVFSIIITEKTLIHESEKCHNVFYMQEKDEHFSFNNLQEIHVLDLSRICKEKNEKLSDWLRFINSDDEEELMALAQKNEMINKAYCELKMLSADKKKKMLYEARLKQQRDICSIEDGAKREGMEISLERGRKEGMQKGRQNMQKFIAYLNSGHSLEEAKKKFLQD